MSPCAEHLLQTPQHCLFPEVLSSGRRRECFPISLRLRQVGPSPSHTPYDPCFGMPFSKFEVVPGTCGEPCFQKVVPGEWIAPAGWCNIIFRDHDKLGHWNSADMLAWGDSHSSWIKDKVKGLGYTLSTTDLVLSRVYQPCANDCPPGSTLYSQGTALKGGGGVSGHFVPYGTPSFLSLSPTSTSGWG